MPRWVLVVVALGFITLAVRGVLRGQIRARELFVRDERPFGFWLHVVTFGVLGLFLIYLTITAPGAR